MALNNFNKLQLTLLGLIILLVPLHHNLKLTCATSRLLLDKNKQAKFHSSGSDFPSLLPQPNFPIPPLTQNPSPSSSFSSSSPNLPSFQLPVGGFLNTPAFSLPMLPPLPKLPPLPIFPFIVPLPAVPSTTPSFPSVPSGKSSSSNSALGHSGHGHGDDNANP